MASPARVLLRLPRDLHRSISRTAAAAGLSFNQYCVRRLAAPGEADAASAGSIVCARARSIFGARLAGVAALGSWARGEAGSGSDLDVLIVIDPAVPLTRDLYRKWDATPLVVDGRQVDAHFAHLPPAAAALTAVWCEVAVDGLLWYDRDGDVARRLTRVRREIADGRVVRAFAHGQPYWKGAA